MNTGRNCDKMTDMSAQEMMENLSEKRLPVRSSQYIMNHDLGMNEYWEIDRLLGNSTKSNYLDIFIRFH